VQEQISTLELTFRGFTGTSNKISDSLSNSCIKDPLQQPAAIITAFLLYKVFLEVRTASTSSWLPDLGMKEYVVNRTIGITFILRFPRVILEMFFLCHSTIMINHKHNGDFKSNIIFRVT
jgi:hypothetical protein